MLVRMVRLMALLMSILVGLGLVVGAQQIGGTLRIASAAFPPTLDCHYTSAGQTRTHAGHIHEALMALDEGFGIIPQLAESWEMSEDGLVYTFHLRDGVRFHDGSELDAVDVKASIERFLVVSQRGTDFSVDEINILDPLTVEIKLPSRTHLLAHLANPVCLLAIMPSEIMEQNYGPGQIPNNEIIGAGPYRVEKISPEQIVLVRFEDYQPDTRYTEPTGLGGYRTAYLDRLEFNWVPEAGARVAGLETGEYDFADSIPLTDYGRLEDILNIEVKPFSLYFMPYFRFNCVNSPTDNVLIRKAILLALDTEQVMEGVTGGRSEFYELNSSLFWSVQTNWNTSAADDYYNQRDLDKAHQLMEQAGYNGEPIVIRSTKDYPWMYSSSLVVASQLEEAGFTVKLEMIEWATVSANWKKESNYNIHFTGWSPRFEPVGYYFEFLSDSGINKDSCGCGNDVYDALVKLDMETNDYETRYQIWEVLQVLLYTYDPHMVKLGDLYDLHAFSTKVKGYRAWFRPFFWDVWQEG